MRTTASETETDTTLRLMTAMDRHHPVTITYLKANGDETIRTIETYAIEVSNAGDILLKVMDRQSGEKRTFRLDRIQAYTVHRSSYTVPLPADAKPTTPKAFCTSCSYLCEADELVEGPSADLVCSDCLSSWQGQPDVAGGFTFAYAR
jgi:predicted DNA-binding transcriptional regulator YafY